ncbi:hypothetical protein [Pedosphaera parvula]|uniref:Uncharacterized protein n=1 Tax=Pedosphaera parvula (strain Ellin514) TaxID=320771 RepID=B9XI63_PEDPL|nr:hypothetical protein [Pedosphaera parvula]EEF60556.1 hypothetical protein Cflav_PD3526 [Pedosphaera parvula Ellin514]
MKSLNSRKHLLAAMLLRTILLFALSDFFFCSAQAAELDPSPLTLTFCCSETNDLYQALVKGGAQYSRFDQAADAFEHAQPNSAVLILADHYPNETTRLEPDELTLAQSKQLHLYLEYPGPMTGLEVATPRNTVWERGIVSSDAFGPTLPKLRLLAIHDCHFTPLTATNAWIMVGRVAGYDTAVYGLPKEVFPILAEFPDKRLLVATTKLSGFVTGRYAPYGNWETVWQTILAKLDPQTNTHKMVWSPTVVPAFGPTEKLPRHLEKQAFDSYANWIPASRLLVTPERKAIVEKTLSAGGETIETPGPESHPGDGSLGILEGYASGIRYDGNQLQRLPLRADCNTDTAMVLALDYSLNGNKNSRNTASNLLDYVYFNSGMCGGVRADPKSGAFGLIGWGAIAPAWLVANYGDDNANAMLSTMAASSCLKNDHWDEMLMRALLANLRTTGKLGFRGDRIDIPALEQQGWKPFHDSTTINYSPHFEAFLWACNLWAYRQTGFAPFLNKATNAISMTMKAYPDGWRWQDNIERAHMLLCLSWLVRVQDTPLHRSWLKMVATDLLVHQRPSGSIHEWLSGKGGDHDRIPQSNEAYGTAETPLIQQNGDPASDQLYTTGYALLGLHEAVGATGDKDLKKAEDKLAEFLCRIQIRSARNPYVNGTWFRAFDDQRWDFWASSADAGWGAWSIEAGWGQTWTAATLGLRQKKTTFWELTSSSRIKTRLQKVKAEMSMRDEDF